MNFTCSYAGRRGFSFCSHAGENSFDIHAEEMILNYFFDRLCRLRIFARGFPYEDDRLFANALVE